MTSDAARHWIAALPCVLPLSAVGCIFLAVILHRYYGFRGAIIHDLSTPLGALLTAAAYLYVSVPLWGPAGLVASIILSALYTSGRQRLWHPVLYLLCCVSCFALLVLDPGGVFTHFID